MSGFFVRSKIFEPNFSEQKTVDVLRAETGTVSGFWTNQDQHVLGIFFYRLPSQQLLASAVDLKCICGLNFQSLNETDGPRPFFTHEYARIVVEQLTIDTLLIAGFPLSPEAATCLGTSTILRELRLSRCLLTDDHLVGLSKCKSLSKLTLTSSVDLRKKANLTAGGLLEMISSMSLELLLLTQDEFTAPERRLIAERAKEHNCKVGFYSINRGPDSIKYA